MDQYSYACIQDLGITQLWLPPPSQSVSKQGYLPGQLYDVNTPYGSSEDLINVIKALKSAGIAPLAGARAFEYSGTQSNS
jgi:alpha-amylase